MRLLHTADWHLGRIFHGVHLTEDQAHLLDQVVAIAADSRVDAVLVAGDVYDRAVPPPDAVRLLGDTLERLVRQVGVPTFIVAGNHDSPHRLEFCSAVLAEGALHIRGILQAEPHSTRLADAHGPVRIVLVPFAEPAVARERLDTDDVHSHADVLRAVVGRIRPAPSAGERTVLVTHAFVAGGQVSESERPLVVGGASHVEPSVFADLDYVALGHLHRPQTMAGGRLRYPGSLMKYSFDEAAGQRGVTLVELGPEGEVGVEAVPLTPRHDVRRLEGSLDEVVQQAGDDPAPEDYLMVTLTDPGLIHDPMGRLRQVYPNVLHVARPALGAASAARLEGLQPGRRDSVEDLFAQLYRDRRGQELDSQRRAILRQLLERLAVEAREASP